MSRGFSFSAGKIDKIYSINHLSKIPIKRSAAFRGLGRVTSDSLCSRRNGIDIIRFYCFVLKWIYF